MGASVAVVTRSLDLASAAKGVVLRSGSASIRAFGMVTARFRPNPDFLLIGAKRGGSTSFYFDLITHPQVALLFPRPDHLPKAAATKGIHYFDSNYGRGMRWYRSHLPSERVRKQQADRTGGEVVVGEGSPYYLTHPAAPSRVAGDLPGVRLVAVLRDPVERAYSHWKERVREGKEPLSFGDAVDAEVSRVGDDESRLSDPAFYSYAHEHQSYVMQSRYGASLHRWFRYHPISAFHLLRSEDYYANPSIELDRTALFLGIEPGGFEVGSSLNAAPGNAMDPGLRRILEELLREDAILLRDATGITWDWV